MNYSNCSMRYFLFSVISGLALASADAATYSFSSTGTFLWSNTSSWTVSGTTPSTVPGSADSISTNGIGTGGVVLSIDGTNRTITNLDFLDGGNAFTIQGASGAGGTSLTVTGTLTKASSNSLSVRSNTSTTNPLTLTINELVVNGGGNAIFGTGANTGLAAFTATTLRLSGATNVRMYFGKIVSGTANIQNVNIDQGQLSVYGGSVVSGTQTLATNSISGSTGFISSANSSSGTNTATGILLLNSVGTSTFSGTILDVAGTVGVGTTATLALVKSGTGTQILGGANTYSGGTTLNDGILQLGTGGTNGSIVGNVATTSSSAILAINRSNAYTYSGTISGSGQVKQIGTGTTTLTGIHSYTGTTTISQGTLLLSAASNNIAGSAAIDIASGASLNVAGVTGGFTLASVQTLKGTGTVVGNLTTGSGSTLSPGNSPGTLSVTGNVTLGDFTHMTYDQGDLIAVSGSLTLGNSFSLTATSDLAAGNYDIFTYTGSLFNAGDLSTWTASGLSRSYSFLSDGDSVFLSVVPEPQTYVLAGLGLGVLLWRSRVRKASTSS